MVTFDRSRALVEKPAVWLMLVALEMENWVRFGGRRRRAFDDMEEGSEEARSTNSWLVPSTPHRFVVQPTSMATRIALSIWANILTGVTDQRRVRAPWMIIVKTAMTTRPGSQACWTIYRSILESPPDDLSLTEMEYASKGLPSPPAIDHIQS